MSLYPDKTYPGCPYCGDRRRKREKDHVTPRGRGGTEEEGNKVSACISCNRDKRAMHLHEWRAYRKHHGLPWPPLASHATDPRHYKNHTCRCPEAHVPYSFEECKDGYLARYECPEERARGDNRGVWWAVSRYFYDDCHCEYCKQMCAVEDDLGFAS